MRGDVIDILGSAALFRDLTTAEIDEVRASIEPRHFADGEALMAQGAASDGAYVIASGRVAVAARLPGGGEAAVSELGPGDLLGEMALLSRGGKRSATARAVGSVEALFVDRRHFDASANLLRPASLKLLRRLGLIGAARLRSVQARIRELVAASTAASLFRPWPHSDGAAAAFAVRAFLPVLPPFREFAADQLDRLFDVADVELHPRGAVVQEAGEPAAACRLVVRGALLVGHRHGERLHQLDVLGPGRFAGVAPVIESAPTGAAAIAAEPSTLLRFDADIFRMLWSGEDRLALRLINAVNADIVQLAATASNHLARLQTQARLLALTS
jgi:CRP/FNR family transcriptional regulator, cyclic AMP receptor protein